MGDKDSPYVSSWCNLGVASVSALNEYFSSESASLAMFSELVALSSGLTARLDGDEANEQELAYLNQNKVEIFQVRTFEGFLLDRLILRVISGLNDKIQYVTGETCSLPLKYKMWLSCIQDEAFRTLQFCHTDLLKKLVVANSRPLRRKKESTSASNAMKDFSVFASGSSWRLRQAYLKYLVNAPNELSPLLFFWLPMFETKKYRRHVLHPRIGDMAKFAWTGRWKKEYRESMKIILGREVEFWRMIKKSRKNNEGSHFDRQIVELLMSKQAIMGASRQVMNLRLCLFDRIGEEIMDSLIMGRLRTLKKIIVDRLSEKIVYQAD